jgi:hypothetical protein
MRLLESTFPLLVNYIYSHKEHEIYCDPETRVGILIKLLHSLDMRYDEILLKPIIDDIEDMINSEQHLESTENPERRKKCLEKELNLVQRYIDMDDTISLNTDLPTIPDQQVKSEFEDDQCVIV